MVKLRILRWEGFPGRSGGALHAITRTYVYKREGEKERTSHRGEDAVKTELTGCVRKGPQAKDCGASG